MFFICLHPIFAVFIEYCVILKLNHCTFIQYFAKYWFRRRLHIRFFASKKLISKTFFDFVFHVFSKRFRMVRVFFFNFFVLEFCLFCVIVVVYRFIGYEGWLSGNLGSIHNIRACLSTAPTLNYLLANYLPYR